MQIHNFLPRLVDCLKRWEQPPSVDEFVREYYEPMASDVGVVFDWDGADFHSLVHDVDWPKYRAETLTLDPAREEKRLLRQIEAVERLFEMPLEGEAVLFGAFTSMDGYARFDQGTHRVFLGVDESHGRGAYLDVLISHELTHVARESRPEVWTGFGLNPKMTHDEFTEYQPVIEHLVGEGFSCAVSEILVPGEDPWHYAYQDEASMARVIANAEQIDREVRKELRHPDGGDYGRFYNPSRYGRGMPQFSHYVWAWQWVKKLLQDRFDGDPRKMLRVCSGEFIEHALSFELAPMLRG